MRTLYFTLYFCVYFCVTGTLGDEWKCSTAERCVKTLEKENNITLQSRNDSVMVAFCLKTKELVKSCLLQATLDCNWSGEEEEYQKLFKYLQSMKKKCNTLCSSMDDIRACSGKVSYLHYEKKEYKQFCRSYKSSVECKDGVMAKSTCSFGEELFRREFQDEEWQLFKYICDSGCLDINSAWRILERCTRNWVLSADESCRTYYALEMCLSTSKSCPEIHSMVPFFAKEYDEYMNKCSLQETTKVSDLPKTSTSLSRSSIKVTTGKIDTVSLTSFSTKSFVTPLVSSSTHRPTMKTDHTPLMNSTARSDIACNSDNIEVFLPIALLPKVSNVTWLDPSCHILTNRTHFVSSLPHTSCGTTVTLTDDSVIFENQIIAQTGNTKADNKMLNFGLDSHIIPVKCIYPRKEMAMTSYQPVQPQITFYEKQFGHLNIDMKQFSSNRFDRALEQTQGSRKLTLNSDIYVKVNLHQSSKSNLGMRLDACIVTKTPSPYDSVFYKLIQDGCPTAKFVHIYTSPSNEARFTLKAFEFTSNRSNVMYIHCQTSVCMTSSPHCAIKCSGSGRQRRDITSDKSHLLSMGPLVFVTDAETNASLVSNIMAGTFAGVAFIAIVVAIVGWRR